MDLRSHYPYSLLKKGIIRSYPSLDKNIRTDVAVIGAGISGALVAWHLARVGIHVTVFDRRHVGMGSTAASTGLLQYEIDTPLNDLIQMIGEKNAVESYRLCRKAIYDLQSICELLKMDTGFRLNPSLKYATKRSHTKDLEKEFDCRKNAGFDVEWLDERDLLAKYGFKKQGAIFSTDGGELDAYSLTHALLSDPGHPVATYDHTEITKIRHENDHVELKTGEGHRVHAKKLVIACGYESQSWLPHKLEKFHTTYSIISEPLKPEHAWYRNSLIWGTGRDYLYMRSSIDNRILVGGLDDPFNIPFKRERSMNKKAGKLGSEFAKLFPEIPFRKDFQWAGVFASTKDGLPYIGTIPRSSHTWYALGYGGNGITFSLLAAQIIRDEMKGVKNPASELFGFDR